MRACGSYLPGGDFDEYCICVMDIHHMHQE